MVAPPARSELVANVREAGEWEAEGGIDSPQGAQLPAPHDLGGPHGEGVVAVVEGLHHHQPGALGRRNRHLPGFNRVRGERLLAEHVLAGFQGFQRPLRVQSVGQRVVDGIDAGVVQQGLIRVRHPGNVVLARELDRPLPVPGRHGGHRDSRLAAGRPDDRCGCDAGGPEDANADVVRGQGGLQSVDR